MKNEEKIETLLVGHKARDALTKRRRNLGPQNKIEVTGLDVVVNPDLGVKSYISSLCPLHT